MIWSSRFTRRGSKSPELGRNNIIIIARLLHTHARRALPTNTHPRALRVEVRSGGEKSACTRGGGGGGGEQRDARARACVARHATLAHCTRRTVELRSDAIKNRAPGPRCASGLRLSGTTPPRRSSRSACCVHACSRVDQRVDGSSGSECNRASNGDAHGRIHPRAPRRRSAHLAAAARTARCAASSTAWRLAPYELRAVWHCSATARSVPPRTAARKPPCAARDAPRHHALERARRADAKLRVLPIFRRFDEAFSAGLSLCCYSGRRTLLRCVFQHRASRGVPCPATVRASGSDHSVLSRRPLRLDSKRQSRLGVE
jgi:hypothetical protein